MIALVTTDTSRFVFDEVTKGEDIEVHDLTKHAANIRKLNEALLENQYSVYLIDIDAFVSDPEDVADELIRLKKASTAQIIIFGKGYSQSAHIIQALKVSGFRYFVTSSLLGDMKEQLSLCLQGIENADKLTAREKLEHTGVDSDNNEPPVYRTVGFIGCINRIGTTTQAIQLVKYIQSKGFSACYIEAGMQKDVIKLPDIYTPERFDKELGYVSHEGVDMYYNPFKLSEIKRQDYDVCVYDYGVFKTESLFSFLGNDIRVCVNGIEPKEIYATTQVIRCLNDEDATYLFSFTAPEYHSQVRESMAEKKDKTFFSAYSPDMYSLCSGNKAQHEHLIKLLNPSSKKNTSKKKLFGGKLLWQK